MTPDIADNSCFPADKGLHEKDVVKSVRTYAGKLFAEIAVRIVAYGADMIVILFAMTVINDHVVSLDAIGDELRIATWVLLMSAYFTLSWISPMRSTPFQFLFRMRVLHESGRPLSPREAAIRGVALVALWSFATYALRQFVVPGFWLATAVVPLLLYVPAVTARRQGLHDFLARSVVVNKRALRSAGDWQNMQDYLADRQLAGSRAARPPIYKMFLDAVALAVPLFLMMTIAQVGHQKNLYGRVVYAMHETREIKQLAENWYFVTDEWPKNESELGVPLRHNYPAGGYFQLEEGGAIRIQFEVLDELKNGSILLEPQVADGEVTWHCRTTGNIEQSSIPGSCR